MGLYEFLIIDKDGEIVAQLDSARNRSFATYLNKAGETRFTVPPTDPRLTRDALLLGHKELRIYRAGTLVWGGELAYGRTDLDIRDERVEVAAKGYFDLFTKRFIGTADTPISYESGWELAEIAESLVDTYADDLVTIGAIPDSRDAERTNIQYRSLKDAIEGLSNENVQDGIDFEVTPDKVFNAFYPQKGRVIDSVVFEWGINIDSFFEILDATEMVNQVIVLGAGEGNAMLTVTRNSDPFLQETYRLRQGLLSHKDIINVEPLESHGDRELTAKQLPQQIIGVRTKGNLPPTFGSYEVGDTVRVKVKRGLIDLDGYYRIYGIEVDISEEDEESITLILNKD